MRFRQLLPLIGALFSLYIIWGSTYFVIRIGVESWPPLMMAGIRFSRRACCCWPSCCCAA
jgi:drug/metabolite transporter (DMT)-like permease